MASAGMYVLVDGVLVRGATVNGAQGEPGADGAEGPPGADGMPASEFMAVDPEDASVLIVTLPGPVSPFAVTSVTPETFQVTEDIDVVLAGTGFLACNHVVLAGYVFIPVTPVSDTELVVPLALGQLEAGIDYVVTLWENYPSGASYEFPDIFFTVWE